MDLLTRLGRLSSYFRGRTRGMKRDSLNEIGSEIRTETPPFGGLPRSKPHQNLKSTPKVSLNMNLDTSKSHVRDSSARALQETFDIEMSKGLRESRKDRVMDASGLSTQTDSDSTTRFMTILDKINENQHKKNKFYADIIKEFESSQNKTFGFGLHDSVPDGVFDADRLGISRIQTHKGEDDEEESLSPFKHYASPTGAQTHEMMLRQKHKQQLSSERGSASEAGTMVEHILELHQPRDNEIIFECSKEWTVNQTPDMREKELIPAQLAAHWEKLREQASQLSPGKQEGQSQEEATGKSPRLSCQKNLFGPKS